MDIYSSLTREDMEILLMLHQQLDDLLDEGLINNVPISITLKQVIDNSLKVLQDYEGMRKKGNSHSFFLVYLNPFKEKEILTTQEDAKKEYENLISFLKAENIIKEKISELEGRLPIYRDHIVIEKLEVFGKFIGVIALKGENLDDFHRNFTSIIARKIDTDIYNYNQFTVEKIKSEGVDKIGDILDSDLSLEEKYQEVMKVVVEAVQAYSGYLVTPYQGSLTISARYILENAHHFTDEEIINLAKVTLQKAKENQFIRMEEVPVSKGEILTILLKPGEKDIEGVMVLHHRDFNKPHMEIAKSYANLIDSSLHTDHLYVKIFENFLKALAVIIDTFDTYTSGHSKRVASYSKALGKVLGLSKLEMTKLYISAMLHDIGKVGVDPNIIRKKGRLTPEEMQVVQSHAIFSDNILNGVFPFDMRDIHFLAGSHHEKEDGTGYPRRLKSEEIPFLSKIIAIADIFDALTSDRPYHRGMDRDKAFKILEEEAEKGKLSKKLVDLFKSPKTWSFMRWEYQNLKIGSAFHWYKKEMLPDLKPITEELEKTKKALEDIHRVRKKYKKGELIDLVALEDSVLSPSEKDVLIQREAQKNEAEYMQILKEMENKYRHRLHHLEAKRRIEIRFRERFWDPHLIEEIYLDMCTLNDKGVDFLEKREDIIHLYPKDECPKKGRILDIVECYLEKSKSLKGLNKDYQVPLRRIKHLLEHIMGVHKEEIV